MTTTRNELIFKVHFCITHQYLNLGIGTEYRHSVDSVDTTTGTINLFVCGHFQYNIGIVLK